MYICWDAVVTSMHSRVTQVKGKGSSYTNGWLCLGASVLGNSELNLISYGQRYNNAVNHFSLPFHPEAEKDNIHQKTCYWGLGGFMSRRELVAGEEEITKIDSPLHEWKHISAYVTCVMCPLNSLYLRSNCIFFKRNKTLNVCMLWGFPIVLPSWPELEASSSQNIRAITHI